MRIRLRRPRYQRNVRVLLAFAFVIPAAGIMQAAGTNTVSSTVSVVLLLASAASVWDAYRWIVIITRHGIGIAGVPGSGVTWLAWGEILQVDLQVNVVSLTTRGAAIHHLQLDQRAAYLLCRMVERHLVRGARI